MGNFAQVLHVYRASQSDTIDHLSKTLRGFKYSVVRATQLSGASIVDAASETNAPAYIVGPPLGDWTPIIDLHADPWIGNVARKLGKVSRTYVITMMVHDDDVMLYDLDLKGAQLDGYNSLPLYFEKTRPSDSDIESQRHNPQHFEPLLPEGKTLDGLQEILDDGWWSEYDTGRLDSDGVMSDEGCDRCKYDVESERMTDMGTYLDLAGKGVTYPFAYWDDAEEIDWSDFVLLEYSKRNLWPIGKVFGVGASSTPVAGRGTAADTPARTSEVPDGMTDMEDADSPPKTRFVGASLYIDLPADAREELLRKALVDSGGSVAGVQLRYIETSRPGSGRYSTRKVSEKSLADLLTSYAQGELDTISGYDRRLRSDMSIDDPSFSFDIHEYHDIQRLSVKGARELCDQASLVAYLRSTALEFGAQYGFICAGNFTDVTSRVSLITILPWNSDADGEDEGSDHDPIFAFGEEIEFYQVHRDEPSAMIPRAEWGNILSPAHIAGLGGEERIRKESGCFLVERWGENLYIQLTESLWDVSKEQLQALNRYMEPIRFPDAPEPVYL